MPLRKQYIEPPAGRKPRLKPLVLRERLLAAMNKTGFTIADMAVWLDRLPVTVRSWLYGKTPRRDFRTDDLDARLLLIDRLIRLNAPGLPVPVSLSQRVRGDHVRRIYKDACAAIAKGTLRGSDGVENRRGNRTRRVARRRDGA